MRDDPRRNLKWLEQELLTEEEDLLRRADAPAKVSYDEEDDLLELVDMLLEDDEEEWEEEEPPIRNFANRYGAADRAVSAAQRTKPAAPDENTAVLVKSRKQLRAEEKLRKKAEKEAAINRNIKDLVFLAALELLGILAIIGWWLQWLI